MSKEFLKIVKDIQKKSPKIIREQYEQGTPKTILMDSPQLNYALGGAFVLGKIYNFFGPFSGGKSSIACYIAGQLQKKMPITKQTIVYVDFERSFNTRHAIQIGLDCNDVSNDGKLLYLAPDTIEDLSDALVEIVKSDEVCLIILDSEAAAPTRISMTDPAGKANFGQGAKAMAEFMKKFNVICANYETSMIVISQERANMNVMSHLPSVTGGYALPFYASYRARITKVDLINEGDETIGQNIRLRNYKSKIGIPFRDANMTLYYGNGKSGIKGFDSSNEYIDFFLLFNIITQSGAFFKIPGEEKSIQGRAKLQVWLEERPEQFEIMKTQVNDSLNRQTHLDLNNKEPEDDDVISEDILESKDEEKDLFKEAE